MTSMNIKLIIYITIMFFFIGVIYSIPSSTTNKEKVINSHGVLGHVDSSVDAIIEKKTIVPSLEKLTWEGRSVFKIMQNNILFDQQDSVIKDTLMLDKVYDSQDVLYCIVEHISNLPYMQESSLLDNNDNEEIKRSKSIDLLTQLIPKINNPAVRSTFFSNLHERQLNTKAKLFSKYSITYFHDNAVKETLKISKPYNYYLLKIFSGISFLFASVGFVTSLIIKEIISGYAKIAFTAKQEDKNKKIDTV